MSTPAKSPTTTRMSGATLQRTPAPRSAVDRARLPAVATSATRYESNLELSLRHADLHRTLSSTRASAATAPSPTWPSTSSRSLASCAGTGTMHASMPPSTPSPRRETVKSNSPAIRSETSSAATRPPGMRRRLALPPLAAAVLPRLAVRGLTPSLAHRPPPLPATLQVPQVLLSALPRSSALLFSRVV
jgi:hypothetical protein